MLYGDTRSSAYIQLLKSSKDVTRAIRRGASTRLNPVGENLPFISFEPCDRDQCLATLIHVRKYYGGDERRRGGETVRSLIF
jgi:hypothetical protein